MDDLDAKASSLGRILAMFQAAANQELPVVILTAQLRAINRLSGELLEDLKNVDPGTVVHVNPMLGDATTQLLEDYFHGRGVTPDTLPDEWTNNG